MPVGHPTKYREGFIDEVDRYLATTGREQTTLPTVEGFARHLGVNGDSIVEWCKDPANTAFSAAIKRLKEVQKHQLMDDGLYGGKEVNSTMAIFLLKVNHNMIESSHTDITTGGDRINNIIITREPKDGSNLG